MTVIKIIELVGVSKKGLQDAVENAVKEASKSNMRNVFTGDRSPIVCIADTEL